MVARRLHDPVQVRCKTRKALKHSRYRRVKLLVNPVTPQVETVKVNEMWLALRLLDAFHLTFTSGKHLFMLEPASVTTEEALTCVSGWPRALRTATPCEATGCVNSLSHRVKRLWTLEKRVKVVTLCLLEAENTL